MKTFTLCPTCKTPVYLVLCQFDEQGRLMAHFSCSCSEWPVSYGCEPVKRVNPCGEGCHEPH